MQRPLWATHPQHGVYNDLDSQKVFQLLPLPASETTYFIGFNPVTISQGLFQMSLNPGTNNYDYSFVTEISYVQGTNTCWWQGANFDPNPVVRGDSWQVGITNSSPHNQYGLDGIGFAGDIVSKIQREGDTNGVDYPCVVTIYQDMLFDLFTTGYDYAQNKLTQKIDLNTVQVCRGTVNNPNPACGTIQF